MYKWVPDLAKCHGGGGGGGGGCNPANGLAAHPGGAVMEPDLYGARLLKALLTFRAQKPFFNNLYLENKVCSLERL